MLPALQNHKLPAWLAYLARIILLLFATSMVVFALVGLSPIDPVKANMSQASWATMDSEQKAELEHYWGSDTPIAERYIHWLEGALRGDFGESLRYGRPVGEVIGERFANSCALMLSAWILSGLLGLALGVIAGTKHGSIVDKVISGICYVLSSTPTFWAGLVALMVFSVWLGWFPVGLSVPLGVDAKSITLTDRIYHLVLPALVLTLVQAPNIALHTREKTIDVLASDYIRFAATRGESPVQIVLSHALRNLVLPALTLELSSFGEVFGGSVLVEQVFSYSGLGQAAVVAGLGSDAPLLVAISLVSVLFVACANILADILTRLIDPRIAEGGRQYD